MPSAIPGYGQDQPTEEAAIDSLADLMGLVPADAEWTSTATRVDVLRPVVPLDDLEVMAQGLTTSENNLARVGGRSLRIRIVSYRALRRATGATA
jgi:hypothetical protein